MSNYDLAVIGGGPAGLAAATIAYNNHMKFALITPDLGGKVNYGFALRDRPAQDSVWGADLVHQFEKTMESLPTHHIKEEVSQIVREDDGIFRITLIGAECGTYDPQPNRHHLHGCQATTALYCW